MLRTLPRSSAPVWALLFGLIAGAAASAVTPESSELESVLQELRQVEARIERYLIEQAGSRAPASGSRNAAESPMPAPLSSSPPRPEAAEDWGLGVSDEIETLARAKVEARAQLAEAEAGLRLNSALLAHELAREASNPAMLTTLALMQARHRASANLGVEQLLRLEQVRIRRRPEPSAGLEEPQAPAADPLPASPGTLEELRLRHREISARLSELSAGAEERRPTALQFREQRAQLNALMARLSSDETPGAAPVGRAAGSSGLAEQGLVPSLPSTPDPEGRKVFWRANRAKIHAIATGKVLYAGPFAGYRHLLILDHGDGWSSLYGNMTQCYVRVDETLSLGSVLGEYQAEHIGEPEPFWLEVRLGPEPVEPERLPGIAENWSRTVIGDAQP